MPVSISGDGAVTGVASVETPTTLSGLTIPTTGFGKVLQVVRATTTSGASTSSTSYTDAGFSVTVTPQLASSAILLICTVALSPATDWLMFLQITDSSNVAVSGAEDQRYGLSGGTTQTQAFVVGYATPGTTSATTYKLRYKTQSGTAGISNSLVTGQFYAMEIAA